MNTSSHLHEAMHVWCLDTWPIGIMYSKDDVGYIWQIKLTSKPVYSCNLNYSVYCKSCSLANFQTFSCSQWTNKTKVIEIAQHNKCFKWFLILKRHKISFSDLFLVCSMLVECPAQFNQSCWANRILSSILYLLSLYIKKK